MRIRQHTSASIGKSERHNERMNDTYDNINVDPEMTVMNVHFKDPCGRSYFDIFKEKEDSKEISTRGLRADATLFDEMIIDVNTMYFERKGGYEYAKVFYEEAFRFAEKKFGAENVISAVMHADEINIAATEECGHPVYHYHLHVTAIPVVDKDILWSMRCKDEALRGTVKNVIHQVSHSKKWASKQKELDENGQPVLRANGQPKFVKSYSLLQDELFEHMRNAGFADFERGEKGSTARHLSSLQHQYKKDLERCHELEKSIEAKAIEYEAASDICKTFSEIDDIGTKRTLTGKIIIENTEFNALKSLAKEGVSGRKKIRELEEDAAFYRRRYSDLSHSYRSLEKDYHELRKKCEPYLTAIRRFPEKVMSFMDSILEHIRQERERNEQNKSKETSGYTTAKQKTAKDKVHQRKELER
ncbi:MAG: plasmid recombination protein [Parasporobacterium sp.]|nr:plasmid recombination protein [Parasporobacterium sp.]